MVDFNYQPKPIINNGTVDIYQPQLLFMPDFWTIKVVATVAVHKVNGCLTWWTNVTTTSSLAIQPANRWLRQATVGWDKQPLGETSNMYICIYIYICRALMTSIFEGQPLKTRPFPGKTRGPIWVLDMYVGSTPHPVKLCQMKRFIGIPEPKHVIILVGDCYWMVGIDPR